jgi:putative AlgH/UPF0301 family transcriptional regulator
MIRRLQFIHNIPDSGGIPIMINNTNNKQYFAGGQIIKAISEVPSSNHDFQFYVGCCIWEESGLQTEIDKGYWFPMKANVNIINDSNNTKSCLWKQLLDASNLTSSDSISSSSSSSSSLSSSKSTTTTIVESLDI